MDISRRHFLGASAAVGLGALAPSVRARRPDLREGAAPDEPRGGSAAAVRVADRPGGPGYDPWLEVDGAALRANAREVARLAGGRPVLGVVKNNAYGLGLRAVGPVLDAAPEIGGLAVVKADEAFALRDAGVRGPILLMGLAPADAAADLVARDIRLAPFRDGAADRLAAVARRAGRAVPVHLYIDTGMSRLGMPHHRALPWIEALAAREGVRVEGAFTAFTEDESFDPEQLERFRRLARAARERGLSPGALHAASSHGLFFRRDALLDMVRPGLALFGAYPAGARATGRASLRPAVRLRARVVRLQRLRPGDGVSYGRDYVAERPTWIATLPVGHADGYPRAAVDGCEVLIDGRTYPVIGAVSASHTIVEIGQERRVEVGEAATLVGPDDPAVHPNTVAERAGRSVYDVLMHLSPRLPVRTGAT